MTYREKMKAARWLCHQKAVTFDAFRQKFPDIDADRIVSCEYFTTSTSLNGGGAIQMTDENLDNYRAAIQAEIIALRDWVEPIVSILALLLSIAALVVSLTT